MRTEQEWIKALSRCSGDCIFLDAVPVDQRTHAVCLAAVKKYGRDLKHVPVPLRTVEICSEALYKGFGGFWHDAERKELIPEAIIKEVQKVVEERKRNDKLYNAWLTLVKNDWRVLEHVPDHLRREGIIKAALKQSPEATAMIVANINLSQDQKDSVHKFYSGTQNYEVITLPKEICSLKICSLNKKVESLRAEIERLKGLPLAGYECERDDLTHLSPAQGLIIHSIVYDNSSKSLSINFDSNPRNICKIVLSAFEYMDSDIYHCSHDFNYLNGRYFSNIYSITKKEETKEVGHYFGPDDYYIFSRYKILTSFFVVSDKEEITFTFMNSSFGGFTEKAGADLVYSDVEKED